MTSQAVLLEEINYITARHEQNLKNNRMSFQQIENDRSCEAQSVLAKILQEYEMVCKESQHAEGSRDKRRNQLIISHTSYCIELQNKLENELQVLIKETNKVEGENCSLQIEFNEMISQVQNDIILEVQSMIDRYKKLLNEETENGLKQNSRIGIMNMKTSALLQEISDKKEHIKVMLEVEESLNEDIRRLSSEIGGLHDKVAIRDQLILKKELSLDELKSRTRQLQTCEQIFESKIDKLQDQVQPQEMKVESLKRSLERKQNDISRIHESNRQVQDKISLINDEIHETQKKLRGRQKTLHLEEALIRDISSGLHECVQLIQKPDELKSKIFSLQQKCSPKFADIRCGDSNDTTNEDEVNDEISSYEHDKDVLMRQLKKLQVNSVVRLNNNQAIRQQLINENMALLREIDEVHESKKSKTNITLRVQ